MSRRLRIACVMAAAVLAVDLVESLFGKSTLMRTRPV